MLVGSPAAPRLSWCASSHAVAWEFSPLVLPPTETKCVVFTMGVNALTVDAASLLSAFAVNSQVSNSVPGSESEPLGHLPQTNSHLAKACFSPISQSTWETSPRELSCSGNSRALVCSSSWVIFWFFSLTRESVPTSCFHLPMLGHQQLLGESSQIPASSSPSLELVFIGFMYFLSFHSILNLQTRKAMLGEVKMLV